MYNGIQGYLYIAFLQFVVGFVNSGKVPDKEKEHERDYE